MFIIFARQNAEDLISLLCILPCLLVHLKLLCSHGDGGAPLLLQNRQPRGIQQQPLCFANEATRAWQAMPIVPRIVKVAATTTVYLAKVKLQPRYQMVPRVLLFAL